MAFTGTAVTKQISDRCVRVTGLSLAAAAAGIFGLFGSTVVGAEALPDGFAPEPFTYGGVDVTQIESVRVTWNFVGDAPATGVPLRIVKTGSGATFAITVTNEDGAAATPDIEFYIEFRD